MDDGGGVIWLFYWMGVAFFAWITWIMAEKRNRNPWPWTIVAVLIGGLWTIIGLAIVGKKEPERSGWDELA